MSRTRSDAAAGRPLRVLVVTERYRPQHGSVPTLLAEELQRRGHHVQVLTTLPDDAASPPSDGRRQRPGVVETIRGVRVHRVPMLLVPSRCAAARAASFALSSALHGRLGMSADVIYVYATRLTTAAGPVLWRRTGGPPLVLHMQDLEPGAIADVCSGRPGTHPALAHALEALLGGVHREASATIGTSDAMTATLVERGVHRSRVHTVSIPAWGREAAPRERTQRHGRRATSFLYAGELGDAQRLDEVLRAAAMVDDDPRFSLDVYGSGSAEHRLRALATLLGLRSVRFRGRVSIESLPTISRLHDFEVVPPAEPPALRASARSPLPASVRHEVPVIAVSHGAAADLVAEHGAGIVASSADGEGIAKAFREAMDLDDVERREMSRRAGSAYERTTSLTTGVDAIETILRSVVREDSLRRGAARGRVAREGAGSRSAARSAARAKASRR